MTSPLIVSYASTADLAGHLAEHQSQGALMLPLASGMEPPAQFARLPLLLWTDDCSVEVSAEVLQVMPGVGIVVRLVDPAEALAQVEGVEPASPITPPTLQTEAQASAQAPAETRDGAEETGHPAGFGPTMWPHEKLLSDWGTLSITDRIHVARHGKLPARRMIIKGTDKKLQQFVLQNPGLTADEVAAMASMAGLDPGLLVRIAGSSEWTRHSSIVRNLVCNPKLPTPQVAKLIAMLPETELRRLTRTGRVRDAVKRLILRKLSGGR